MDPNTALADIRAIVSTVDTADPDTASDRLARLAELADGLDQWITNGGFLPDPWHH
jgi:hypothetical protein